MRKRVSNTPEGKFDFVKAYFKLKRLRREVAFAERISEGKRETPKPKAKAAARSPRRDQAEQAPKGQP